MANKDEPQWETDWAEHNIRRGDYIAGLERELEDAKRSGDKEHAAAVTDELGRVKKTKAVADHSDKETA